MGTPGKKLTNVKDVVINQKNLNCSEFHKMARKLVNNANYLNWLHGEVIFLPRKDISSPIIMTSIIVKTTEIQQSDSKQIEALRNNEVERENTKKQLQVNWKTNCE